MFCFRSTVFLVLTIFCFLSRGFAQWEEQDTGYPEGIGTIFTSIVNENIVWTVGGHEITRPDYHGFSKTINGGLTWTVDTIFVDDLSNFRFTSVFALNENIAWVTMTDDNASIHRGRVLKTTDGGDTWIHQSTAYPNDSEIAHFPAFVYFYDENHGFSAGYYGEHYITNDGGNLWASVSPENIPALINSERPFTSNVWPLGDSTAWYGTSKGRIFKTTNRGHNWSAFDVGLGEQMVFASFKDELNGLATTPAINRNIAKTTDGGETWQILPNQLPVNAILVYVKGTDNTYMYGSGDLPTLTGYSSPGSGFTANDGNNWLFENDMPLEPLFSVSPTVGWAAGNTYDDYIYKWTGPSLDSLDDASALEGIKSTYNPNNFHLSQNYPNPFNPSTTFHYYLISASNVNLVIYNMLGEEVRIIVNEYQPGGEKSVVWDGKDQKGNNVSTGVYVYQLRIDNYAFSKMMVLIH